jgi:hypothetical protein
LKTHVSRTLNQSETGSRVQKELNWYAKIGTGEGLDAENFK